MIAEKLRKAILQSAMQGKLTEQLPEDGNARDLLIEIQQERQRKIKAGEIKATKPLPQIDPEEVPYEVPPNWVWTRIGFPFELYTGNSISVSIKNRYYRGQTSGYPYIATKDVKADFKIDYDNGVKIPFHETKFRIAPEGTPLLCLEGGSAGKKLAITNQAVNFGNKLCAFVGDNNLSTFLFYYLQSQIFYSLFLEQMTGIIGGVGINKVKEIPLPLPPISEQFRIVAVVNSLLPAVDSLELVEQELNILENEFPEKLKKSLLQAAMQGKLTQQLPEDGDARDLLAEIQQEKKRKIKAGEIKATKPLPPIDPDEVPYEIPATWVWTTLGNLSNFRIGKTPSRQQPAYWNNGTINWVSISDMVNNGETFKTKEHITEKAFCECFGGEYCKPGTLLMSFKLSIGKVTILKTAGLHNEAIISISPYCQEKSLEIIKNYLFTFLPMISLTGSTKSAIKGSTLNSKSLNNLLVPLPPSSEQSRIVKLLDKLIPLCESIK